MDFVAFHSFPLHREGKSKANPKQTQCARTGKRLSTAGTTAPSHLFAWSSEQQQAQGVLLEPAHSLHSAPSLSYWKAAALLLVSLPPRPCVYSLGVGDRAGAHGRGRSSPCAGTCSSRETSSVQRSLSCCLLTSSLSMDLLDHFDIDFGIWLSTNLC